MEQLEVAKLSVCSKPSYPKKIFPIGFPCAAAAGPKFAFRQFFSHSLWLCCQTLCAIRYSFVCCTLRQHLICLHIGHRPKNGWTLCGKQWDLFYVTPCAPGSDGNFLQLQHGMVVWKGFGTAGPARYKSRARQVRLHLPRACRQVRWLGPIREGLRVFLLRLTRVWCPIKRTA